ncbi:YihY/virulence factor BrkB family protein [Hymenobacter busanensis]|uniref:YihY/virulence factor BrkB family protein n=1 Tax=Hymenobacter busanensis TaxID=2607656 RepID=A0A7L4ZY13_9BACT|nr:YihY/virulence factor BrkB family protein [Hymenobacter busanensis]KAA9333195.1 YihY/virulence factor BrkB family protein [Hymenobacter busanensis]QHJ08128.1 YihY family inner membrane protein [Hymenobacter busanensis]
MPSEFRFAHLPGLFKVTADQFMENNSLRLAAALAYNAIFSIPPLLLIVIAAAGALFGEEAVQGKLFAQLSGLVSPDAAKTIQESVSNFHKQQQGGMAAAIGIGTLIFAATTFFVTLQESINSIWNLKVKPRNSMWQFVRDRFLSFGLILSVALLMLISFVVSALLSVFTDYLQRKLPDVAVVFIRLVDFVLSLGVTTVLFAMIYRFLPDAIIRWRDVWTGSLITALLFVLGKFLITFYIAQSDPGSAFGAAGSIIVLLVWIYYTSLVIFFGAEFTQQYADCYGQHVQPKAHAVRIEVREVPPGESKEELNTGRPHAEGRWRA